MKTGKEKNPKGVVVNISKRRRLPSCRMSSSDKSPKPGQTSDQVTEAQPFPNLFKIDTANCCIYCYKDCDEYKVFSPCFKRCDKEELASRYMRLVTRYLGFTPLFSKNKREYFIVDNGRYQYSACDSCLIIMNTFCSLYKNLEEVMLKLNWNLTMHRKIMRAADKVPSRLLGFLKVFEGKEKSKMDEKAELDNFRRQFILGSVKKLMAPKVRVARCDSKVRYEEDLFGHNIRLDPLTPCEDNERRTFDMKDTDLQLGKELKLTLYPPPKPKEDEDEHQAARKRKSSTKPLCRNRNSPLKVHNEPTFPVEPSFPTEPLTIDENMLKKSTLAAVSMRKCDLRTTATASLKNPELLVKRKGNLHPPPVAVKLSTKKSHPPEIIDLSSDDEAEIEIKKTISQKKARTCSEVVAVGSGKNVAQEESSTPPTGQRLPNPRGIKYRGMPLSVKRKLCLMPTEVERPIKKSLKSNSTPSLKQHQPSKCPAMPRSEKLKLGFTPIELDSPTKESQELGSYPQCLPMPIEKMVLNAMEGGGEGSAKNEDRNIEEPERGRVIMSGHADKPLETKTCSTSSKRLERPMPMSVKKRLLLQGDENRSSRTEKTEESVRDKTGEGENKDNALHVKKDESIDPEKKTQRVLISLRDAKKRGRFLQETDDETDDSDDSDSDDSVTSSSIDKPWNSRVCETAGPTNDSKSLPMNDAISQVQIESVGSKMTIESEASAAEAPEVIEFGEDDIQSIPSDLGSDVSQKSNDNLAMSNVEESTAEDDIYSSPMNPMGESVDTEMYENNESEFPLDVNEQPFDEDLLNLNPNPYDQGQSHWTSAESYSSFPNHPFMTNDIPPDPDAEVIPPHHQSSIPADAMPPSFGVTFDVNVNLPSQPSMIQTVTTTVINAEITTFTQAVDPQPYSDDYGQAASTCVMTPRTPGCFQSEDTPLFQNDDLFVETETEYQPIVEEFDDDDVVEMETFSAYTSGGVIISELE